MHFLGFAEALIDLLDHSRDQDGAYIGCMKSGEVVSEEYVPLFHFYSNLKVPIAFLFELCFISSMNPFIFSFTLSLILSSSYILLISGESHGMNLNGGNSGMESRKCSCFCIE